MGDVLTKEEDRKVRSLHERLRVQGGTMTADSFLVTKDESFLLSMVDRLVAEVERLRARNEALEKVAKAARKVDQWSFSEAAQTCEECGSLPPNWEALGRDAAALTIAISALAEPGKGGAMSVKVSDKFPLTGAIERLKASACNYGVAADSDSDRRGQVALEKMESAELAIRLSIAKAIRVSEESMRERCALLHEQIDTGEDRDGAVMSAVIKYRDAIRQLPLENA